MRGQPAKLTRAIALFLAEADGVMPITKQSKELGITMATIFKFRKIIREATAGGECFRKYYPPRRVTQPSASEINSWFKTRK